MSNRSAQLFSEAQQLFVGGVNSPVRAFAGVGGTPIFFERGQGARLWDVDGNEYIDYVASWGPLAVGHAHPAVVDAARMCLARGLSFGAPTELESALATKVQLLMPSLERMRFVSSGTEATMSAIRVARGFTQREKIIKFDGCYHGHADHLLVQAGSGALTLGEPNSAGVTRGAAQDTILLPYNNLAAVEETIAAAPGEIAAIIVEPVPGNMGMILPNDDYLPGLRSLCDSHGIVLIFDEVMSGFRVSLGGAQQHYNVRPDLTCLGKVIGGGMPVGAYGGRADIMACLAPEGSVYQAGTLSGNPVAMVTGLTTLNELTAGDRYAQASALTQELVSGLARVAEDNKVPMQASALGTMWGVSFQAERASDLGTAQQRNVDRYAKVFHALLERGVYWAPSAYEAGFVSTAHTAADIRSTVAAFGAALESL